MTTVSTSKRALPSLRLSRRPAIPLVLAAGAYAVALLQRPGVAVADTKINLHVDPVGFLGDVASVWSSSVGLGEVLSGQYSGYLFPMGPFFALGHLLGLAPWLVQRLWLGTVLALAAWGTVRLLDALLERERGPAHLVAGALTLLNPYAVVFANRTSVTLLGYAALPWLLLAVNRGVRDPRGWRWPAAFALVLTASGGGVNAAVTGWVLLGPLLLLLYERVASAARWRALWSLAWRTGLASVLASLWWVVPVGLHAAYGLNFLPFTESVGAIWSSTSLSEVLRLMGYWVTYSGVGFGATLHPYFDTSHTLLFDAPVVAATLVVPGLAIAGFGWTRRLRYAPFFLALVLVGLFVVMAGFPNGSPFRRALTFTYQHVQAVQFLRTTYKAGALPAIGLACLGGLAFGELWRRLPARAGARVACGLGVAVLIAAAAWPLTRGRAIDHQIAYRHVPAAWEQAADGVDRDLPPRSRALVLPGQIFPYYRWGFTQDPILPVLTKRPVAVRWVVPYADLHAADMLYTVDGLVQQSRVLPGQLRPLLDLLSVRSVVSATDDDLELSGALAPADAAAVLRQGGVPAASRHYGPARAFRSGDVGSAAAPALPQVRRSDLDTARPIVRVEPGTPSAIVDGSAEGISGMAAFGALPAGALVYAGDRPAASLRRDMNAGSELVITDTNRRRSFVASRPRQTRGVTLGPANPLPAEASLLDPFGGRSDAETVAVYRGVRDLRSPMSGAFARFPEQRPFAAFDGDPRSYWLADRYLEPDQHWLEVRFERARAVPYVDVLPMREGRTDVTELEIAGTRYRVHPGWNRLHLGMRRAGSLRIRIARVHGLPHRAHGPGALAEVRVPGLHLQELIRPPRLVERAARGADLRSSAISYLFQRDTGDEPFRRAARQDPNRSLVRRGRSQEAALAAEPGDPETELSRLIEPPAPRRYRLDAWVTVAPSAPDHVVDSLAGTSTAARFDSSSRLDGEPRHRASRAFDGSPASAWLAQRGEGAWLAWRTPAAHTLRSLVLEPPRGDVHAPELVRLRSERGATPALRVGPEGRVSLPRPLRGRSFRLELLRAGPGPVGIAELRGASASAPARGSRAVHSGCALTVRAGARRARLRPAGSSAALEAGRPLRARGCGSLDLAAGPQRLGTASGNFRIQALRLRSPAPEAPRLAGGGRLVRRGSDGRGRYDGMRLALAGPSWLVLGESYNSGWRAYCGGRSLGAPQVIDGFANGWRVGPSCRDARLAFAPNATARLSYWISAIACLVLLVLLLLGRRRAEPRLPVVPWADAEPRRPALPLPSALAFGLAAGLVLGFLFALRAGAVLGPLVALALWRGVGARLLILAAGALLAVVVPLFYVLFPPDDAGGFNSEYAVGVIGGHWLALLAYVALAAALALTLTTGRRGAR